MPAYTVLSMLLTVHASHLTLPLCSRIWPYLCFAVGSNVRNRQFYLRNSSLPCTLTSCTHPVRNCANILRHRRCSLLKGSWVCKLGNIQRMVMVGLCTNVSNIVSTTSANPTACAILDLQVLVNVNIPPHPNPTEPCLESVVSRWYLDGVLVVSRPSLRTQVYKTSAWPCLGILQGYPLFAVFAIQCSPRKSQNEATVKVSWSCSSEWMGNDGN